MPPRTRKRKSSEDEEQSPNGARPAKKTTRASSTKKVARNNKSQRKQGEEKEETGQKTMGNRNEPENSMKKTKATMTDAKREVRQMADELIHFIDSPMPQKLIGAGSAGELDGFTSQNADGMSDSQLLDFKKIDGSGNGIHKKANDCIQTFQKIIIDYEALNKGDVNIKQPEGIRWEQDCTDLSDLNKKAMGISLRRLNGVVLSGTHASSLQPPASFSDDIEKVAWDCLEKGRPLQVKTWGEAVQEMMEVLSGVLKILEK